MVKHIIVVSDNSRDNITIYTEEPAFVAIAERNDWWHQVIFFGREDGRLDKSQLDYLEGLLIQEFRKTSFRLTNGTEGNHSWIDKTNKILADKVWNIAQNILQEVANIDLFESPALLDKEPTETGDYSIQLPDGYTIYGKSAQNNYIEFFRYLLKDKEWRPKVFNQVINGKPNSKFLLGTEAKFDRKSRNLSIELEPHLHLLITLSTADRRRVLLRFTEAIGLIITINWG